MESVELKKRLMRKIKYNEDIHGKMSDYDLMLEDLIKTSETMALSLRYPFVEDFTNVKLPSKYLDWQYRCCIELYNLSGTNGFTSYSENGLSWGKSTDGLSADLKSEIMPKVGVPKEEI